MPPSPVSTGTLAFLFTDIEGSTSRWERHHDVMGDVIARHDALMRREIEVREGYVFKTVGDAVCAAFPTASLALAAGLAAQRGLDAEDWGQAGPLRVRMAVHVGAAEERDGDYFGQPVNRVARLLSAGHGGQILLSLPAAELVRDSLPDSVTLRDMGEHRLKDLSRPERIFQILSPDMPTDFPPLRTLDNRPNNLPQQLTPIVGRERDVAAILERFTAQGVRLVTLTGPGGIGKTRLSLQVAAELLDHYPDGVWFVPLEASTDEDLVAAAIAQALGVRQTGGLTLQETLFQFLETSRLLLVLDNFEQVVHAAPFVGRLLSATPGVDVLASSRIRLGITGDHAYQVSPLGLPDRQPAPTDPDQLARYDAVRLFVERARAVKTSFALTADNAAAVAQICEALDGLPLAIELAAARVRLLTPAALLARLQRALHVLIGGERDRPERHQTLRATIAWSHDLLLPSQQATLARLSVFAGGWSLEAAEAVAGSDGDPFLLEDLEALVDHNLVHQDEAADGEPRFHTLATIREFAREQLDALGADEAARVRDAHAAHFLALAAMAEAELTGPEQETWLDRLDMELDNMRAALGWLEHRAEGEQGLRLAGALWRFWWGRGFLSEGYVWLTRFLAIGADAPDAVRARALDAAGVLLSDQGDFPGAIRLHEDALDLFRRAGDTRGMAWVYHNLGVVALHQGRYDEATTLYQQSLDLMTQLGDQHGMTRVLNSLGALAFMQGSYDRAAGLYDESLAIGRRLGDEQHVAIALANLAEAREYQGDLDRAWSLYQDALARLRRLGHRWETAFALFGLGSIALTRGDHALAREMLLESLDLWQAVSDRAALADCLERLAALDVATLHPDRAARLFGAAQAVRDEIGAPRSAAMESTYTGPVASARSQLGADRFAHAWETGQMAPIADLLAAASEGDA